MSPRIRELAALRRIVIALGADAATSVLVGATAAATYRFGPMAQDIRPTEDVDLVVEIRKTGERVGGDSVRNERSSITRHPFASRPANRA